MSVKATTTVSIAPVAASVRSSSMESTSESSTKTAHLTGACGRRVNRRSKPGGRMSSGPEVSNQSVGIDDRAQLHNLGYAQELFRSLGGFQNFALSFSIFPL